MSDNTTLAELADYTAFPSCVKCESKDVALQYKEAGPVFGVDATPYEKVRALTSYTADMRPERLLCVCSRCYFAWVMRTADARQ